MLGVLLRCGNTTSCYTDTWNDDMNCTAVNVTCAEDKFQCRNGHCINSAWHCGMFYSVYIFLVPFNFKSIRNVAFNFSADGEQDCLDGSDEVGCPNITCAEDKFQCQNGHCINMAWRCGMIPYSNFNSIFSNSIG